MLFLLSKGTFQCSTWASLNAPMRRRFHGAVMGMYRDALGEFHSPKHVNQLFSDDDIIYDNSLILPYTMIRLARLSLFCRVIKKQCTIVLDLIKHSPPSEGSWCFALVQDLQWLCMSEKFMCCGGFSVGQWIGFIGANPWASNAIKKHCASPWANVSGHIGKAPKDNSVECALSCTLCLYKCDTQQQLSLHSFKSHGIKDPIRLYVRTNVCPVCLKGFSTRERILEHVRRGRTPCKRQLLLMGPIMSEDQADELEHSLKVFYRDLHHKGKRRHVADAPWEHALGPPTPRLAGPVV